MALVKNPPLIAYLFKNVVFVFLMMGLFINIPRYIEIHFLQPAYVASMISGKSPSGALFITFSNVLFWQQISL